MQMTQETRERVFFKSYKMLQMNKKRCYYFTMNGSVIDNCFQSQAVVVSLTPQITQTHGPPEAGGRSAGLNKEINQRNTLFLLFFGTKEKL